MTPTELKEYMGIVFRAFADHLRNNVPPRTVSITSVEFDPTYGHREVTQDIEVIDVDLLTQEIDAFSRRLLLGDVGPV